MVFKTDTLAKLFGVQNRTLVFDKITILSKGRYLQFSILNQKTTQFKLGLATYFPEYDVKFVPEFPRKKL